MGVFRDDCDFFIRERRWAIECIRDGNQVKEHLGRFRTGGTYCGLLMHDRVIIDFRKKSKPIKPRGIMTFSRIYFRMVSAYLTSVTDDPNFYTVVFDEDYMFCRVYDYHCNVDRRVSASRKP